MAIQESAIRPVTIADSESVARLVSQLGYPTTSEQMASRLKLLVTDPDHSLFVATQGTLVIGLAGLQIGHALEFDQPYARLIGLAVDEEFRGNGIGAMLMRHAEAWAQSRGAGVLILTSGSHRTEAHTFYEHIGYRRTGIRFARQL